MLDDALVSIVVPVYRGEYWLPKCIKSLLAQTYKNLEIVLVDDGSPDKSGDICDKFAKEDSRIKVIHKENGGVSSARNAGINAATGDYICFVDSDDWLTRDAVETLHAEFLKNDIQICIANMQTVGPKNCLYEVVHRERVVLFDDADRLFFDLYQEVQSSGLAGKMFDTSLIKDNSLKLKDGMKLGEDVLFLLECLKYCKAVALIENPIYFYNRLVSGSAITRYYPELTEWILLITEARNDFVREKGELYKNGALYVTKNALIDFEYIVNVVCLQNRCVDEAVEIYKRSYESFAPFFNVDVIKENTVEYRIFDDLVVSYCQNGDYVGLYEKTRKKYIQPPKSLKRMLRDCAVKGYVFMKRKMYRFFC